MQNNQVVPIDVNNEQEAIVQDNKPQLQIQEPQAHNEPISQPSMQIPIVPVQQPPQVPQVKKKTGPTLPLTADGCKKPTTIICPYCNTPQNTFIEYEIGQNTILIIAFLVLTVPCISWIPCCMESTLDQVHFCKKCYREVGRNKYRLFQKR